MQIDRKTFDKGNLVSSETITIPDDFQALAKKALDVTDSVALNCFKSGISFPAEWLKYFEQLRAIADGADGPLPDQPDFPKGS